MTHCDRRGVALMLALWLIVVLAMIGARVASAARTSNAVASNMRARVSALYAAESGVTMAVSRVRSTLIALESRPDRRSEYLNSLQQRVADADSTVLGDARFAFTYVDISSRIDINLASRGQLETLFSFFTGRVQAAAAARSVREWIGAEDAQMRESAGARAMRADLTYPAMPVARPLRSLEELRRIEGIPERLAVQAAPYLTVDGDGRVNRIAASDTVLAAAAGSLVDEPTRLLIVARGWRGGHPLTHEIQAVYAIEGPNLVLVRWQERDL